MQKKTWSKVFIMVGVVFAAVGGIALMYAQTAYAQCGSQASSCKNCHEVQGQDPVNADGTGWHQSHAFGDFCYICHAGNQQAMDKTAAHEGMAAPLSDVKAACQQCHVNDLEARAKVYADALGVTVGSGTASPAAAGPGAATVGAESVPVAESNQCNEIVVDDPNAVNYKQNYDEIVLGRKPVNWGNMILIGMIGLIVLGGGGLVITREKLVNVKFGDTRKVEQEYPADVMEILPKIASLKADARKSLKNVLETRKAGKILELMDEIVRKDEE